MIVLTAMILSPKEALRAVTLYLTLGLIGLPVYSGLKSGFDVLFGPTGGFLLSFPLAAYLIARFKESKSFLKVFIANLLIGIVFVYLCGVGYLSWYTTVSFWKSAKTMLIFIPIDIVKIFLGTLIGTKVHRNQIFTT